MKRDLIHLIPNLLKNFVTPEYFDPEISLVDFLLDFSVDRVNKIVHDSEMSHKTLKAITKIKISIENISFNFDKIILNFEDVENKLFNLVAECNALENYVKLDKFIPEVKKLTEIVYSMIRTNTKIREVHDINVDLRRIITGDVFKLIKDKFDKLNLEITNLIESLKENQNYPLKNLLDKEKIIENLKSEAIELQIYVKNTIISYREAVHRFYLFLMKIF
ncbi:hypothetical protein NBO_43g0015 [Nosema bombycis CQ1]|uniref:Uncharacterized protein n=1 Tax=Nosema bombycis (strain CQ1 / CVCC 102059) TaxID=578461 RepID=R0MIL7_NOSB1|nr:hypothetical protein NBO_43g0015 [Nosema bombycis CQ1]|eukprot:EOB14010.1 hypothetical protein NBO_43g0015 [Nosema bombycis CQ1]